MLSPLEIAFILLGLLLGIALGFAWWMDRRRKQ
jgi:ABC-type transport system involved in cytochrome c biogenesis permease subunit